MNTLPTWYGINTLCIVSKNKPFYNNYYLAYKNTRDITLKAGTIFIQMCY